MSNYQTPRVSDETYDRRISQAAVNCVSLGQWELPGALLESISVTSGAARRLLEAFIKHPEKVWSNSTAIPSPHHLQWLSLVSLKKIANHRDSDRFLEFTGRLVEFRLLLFSVLQARQVQNEIITSICWYHDIVAQANVFETPPKSSPTLPPNCTTFLRSVLKMNPMLGHSLIKHLTCGASQEMVHNSRLLQLLYFDAIHHLLDDLKQLKQEVVSTIEEEPDGEFSSEHEGSFLSEDAVKESNKVKNTIRYKMDHILDYLSFLNPSFTPGDSEIVKLLITLLKFSLDFGPFHGGLYRFEPGKIYSCLLGQNSHAIITKVQETEEFLRQNKSVTVQDMDPVSGPEAGDSPWTTQRDWKETFHKALHDNLHFLEDKMEKGLSMVQSGDFGELSVLLSPPELAPLKPLLLLLAWDRYSDRGSGSELLDTLWPDQDLPSQPELCSACYRLSYQVHLVQWCMKKVQASLQSSEEPSESVSQLSRAGEMFKGLESHSVLYVLYHSTPLGKLDSSEVVDVLSVSPYLLPSLPMIAGQQPPIFSPFATPLKSTSPVSSPGIPLYGRVQSVPPASPAGEKRLRPSQVRDISVYHAFCAIKAVMNAVAVSGKQRPRGLTGTDTLLADMKLSKVAKRRLDYGIPEIRLEDSGLLARPLGDELKENSNLVETSANQFVVEDVLMLKGQDSVKFLVHRAKEHVLQIEPLVFQLEVLENMFSLLFLRQEDTSTEDSETHSPSPSNIRRNHRGSSPIGRPSFLADGDTIRAILNVLQDCMKPLAEEVRRIPRRTSSQGAILLAGDKSGKESPEGGLVSSSISSAQVKQRFTSLKQYVSEALWRLQLLSQQNEKSANTPVMEAGDEIVSPSLERQISETTEEEFSSLEEEDVTTDSEGQKPEIPHLDQITSNVLKFELTESSHRERERRQLSRTMSLKASTRSGIETFLASHPGRQGVFRRSQSELGYTRGRLLTDTPRRAVYSSKRKDKKSEHDSGKEGDVEELLPSSSSKQSKRRRRREFLDASTPVMNWSKKKTPSCKSIVCSMLASPSSLLRSCIKHGNFARANEVVKLKMGGFRKSLLNFVESYPKVCQQLVQESQQWQPQAFISTSKSPESSFASSGISSKLQTAISKASLVSAPLEGLHKLLALPSLDGILYFGDTELETAAKASTLAYYLEDCVPGLVALDLLCTNPIPRTLVDRLVKMASQNFKKRAIRKPYSSVGKLEKISSPDSLEAAPPGQVGLCANIGPPQLLKRLLVLSLKDAYSKPSSFGSPFDMMKSINASLQAEHLLSYCVFVEEYASAYRGVEIYLSDHPSGGEVSQEASLQFREKMNALETVLHQCPQQSSKETVLSPAETTNGSPPLKTTHNHLKKFNVYLSRLASIIAEASQDQGAQTSSLLLLKDMPMRIVGQLIFDRGVTPFHLKESLATLGMDVTEVALKGCCYSPPVTVKPVCRDGGGSLHDVVVLNGGAAEDEVNLGDPCRVSHKILSAVIEAIEGCLKPGVLDLGQLREAAAEEKLQEALAQASLLRLVDLTRLNSEKKICFFTNVLNLVYLHTFIWFSSAGTSLEEKLGVTKEFASLCDGMQSGELDLYSHFGLSTQCGYIVGRLGAVSCYDLHYSILTNGTEGHELLKGLSTTRSGPSRLDRIQPLQEVLPQSVSNKLKFAISDGMNLSPLPKALLPADLEQLLADSQDTSSPNSSMPPQNGFGYLLKTEEVVSTAVDTSLRMSVQQQAKQQQKQQQQQPYSLTPGVLTYIQHESELLASLMKLLCGEAEVRERASGTPPPGPSQQPLAQTLPVSQRSTGKGTKSPTDVKVLEATTSPRGGAMSRKPPLQSRLMLRQPHIQTLPHSWYSVDIQLEFGAFPWLQHFLEQRLIPFVEYDVADSGDSDDDDEHKAAMTKSLLQALASRLQSAKTTPKEVQTDFSVDRKVAFLPASHPMLHQVSRKVFLHVLRTKQPWDALKLMSSEPFTAVAHHPAMRGLREVAARMAFMHLAGGLQGNSKSDIKPLPESLLKHDFQPVQYLSLISSANVSAQLLLSSLDCWSVENNVEMLTYCLAHVSPLSLLHPTLAGNLEKMKVYQKILELVNPALMSSSSTQSSQSLSPLLTSPFSIISDEAVRSPAWITWQEVREASQSDPDDVLENVLLNRGCFALARRWAAAHDLENSKLQKIEVLFLLNILHSGQAQFLPIYQALERFPHENDQIKMCEDVLSKLHEASTATFISDVIGEPILMYLTSKLCHALDEKKLSNYRNRVMGVKIMKCIPETSRGDYQRLMSEPLYLLEQLLMDAKLDWAGQAVGVLRGDPSLLAEEDRDVPGSDHLSFPGLASDSLDLILTFYAVKSLELPLSDMGSATPRSPESQAPTPVPGTPVHPGSLPIGHTHRRTSSNQSQVDSGTDPTPTSFSLGRTPKRPSKSTQQFEVDVGGPPTSSTRSQETGWRPPHRVPRQKDWTKDSEADKCMACKKVVFGTFLRRHHCRRCGEVVCARCSGYSIQVETYSSRQRVCYRCNMYETKDAHQEDQDYDGQMPLLFPPNLALASRQHWTLLPNDQQANRKTRNSFYYEQSPSIELFLSIVEFHSSPESCAKFIMDRVDRLSLKIISDASGQLHKEVDYSFVIGIMKQLILNAKLKFAESGDSSGVELCDTYLSRVAVLGLLVSAKCKFTPTLQDLTKSEVVRRIRDRLVQNDLYGLAIEVSTKCSLDISSVIAAWGLALIKTGQFAVAREKFATCFKMFTTKGSSLMKGELVGNIVKLIESNPLISTIEQEKDWGSMSQAGAVLFEPHQSEECYLDRIRLHECLFYLKTYGKLLQLVAFYVRHGFVENACQLVLEKSASPEVFLEGILVPLLKKGHMSHLEDLMKGLDPTLRIWEPYLMSSCRYFSSRSLLHILYHIQLLMKDYIRAAQTCIKFYIGVSGRNTQVVDLIVRKEYLHNACKHFETALSVRNSGREGQIVHNKKMAAKDIQQWIDITKLQLQLVDFLDYQISSVKATVSLTVSNGPLLPASESLPLTLFGSGHARGALACTALLADPGLKDGFNMATRIIQTFQLPVEDVLCHMAKALVLASRYQDVKDLLHLMQLTDVCPESSSDKIIISAVKTLSHHTKDMKHIDRLIGLLSDEKNKVQAYIQCGKLKSGYLIAVKHNLVDQVRDIARIASQAGQLNMKDICEKWLQANTGEEDKKEKRNRRSMTSSARHK